MTKTHFITLLFESETLQEAYKCFDLYKEFIGKITLPECVEQLYFTELYTADYCWQHENVLRAPSMHIHKLILRDLLDMGYIEACPDDISAEKVYKITFLLVSKGMYCIASELFASACHVISGMQSLWDAQKDAKYPCLRGFINKFADQEPNLEFMKGLLRD